MILGFAHVARNIMVELRPGVGIPNAPEKWPLMARRATSHRLTLVNGKGWFPFELVEYDTGFVEQDSRLTAGLNKVISLARDPSTEREFLRGGLGFQIGSEATLELASRLPQWSVRVAVDLDSSAPIDPPLDIAGYAALAFYSTDVEADRDHLLKHGGRTPTEPFTVKLDREMKIVMLRSPEGTIIELIQVMP